MNAQSLSDQELQAEITTLRQTLHTQEEKIERGEDSASRPELRTMMTRLNQLSIEARRRGLVEE
ncbi:MAG: hypothetical protein P9L94_07460 [Candidatus Hinthialibacter antarcticus]|nr:hypothetical protein [Candidatus Hinthialibacter antarcticus]